MNTPRLCSCKSCQVAVCVFILFFSVEKETCACWRLINMLQLFSLQPQTIAAASNSILQFLLSYIQEKSEKCLQDEFLRRNYQSSKHNLSRTWLFHNISMVDQMCPYIGEINSFLTNCIINYKIGSTWSPLTTFWYEVNAAGALRLSSKNQVDCALSLKGMKLGTWLE